MQFDDNKPIYIQIVDYFKYKIIRQESKSKTCEKHTDNKR